MHGLELDFETFVRLVLVLFLVIVVCVVYDSFQAIHSMRKRIAIDLAV